MKLAQRIKQAKKKPKVYDYPRESDLVLIAQNVEAFALCLSEDEKRRVLAKLSDDTRYQVAADLSAYGSPPCPSAPPSPAALRRTGTSDAQLLEWAKKVRGDGTWLVIGDSHGGSVWELVAESDYRWIRVVSGGLSVESGVAVDYASMVIQATPGATDADLGRALREAIEMSREMEGGAA